MIGRIVFGSALALGLALPASAGPCTQRIAELEKSYTAQSEGSGPTLAPPATTGSTEASGRGPAGDGAPAPAMSDRMARANQAMQALQQAKELDRQGREDDCMQAVSRVEATTPAPRTK